MCWQEIRLFDDSKAGVSGLTIEIISRCFLGDFGAGQVLDDIERLVPMVVDGLLSRPRRFRWPLNRFPGFNYGSAADARKEFDLLIKGVVRERELELASEDVRQLRMFRALDTWSVRRRSSLGGRTSILINAKRSSPYLRHAARPLYRHSLAYRACHASDCWIMWYFMWQHSPHTTYNRALNEDTAEIDVVSFEFLGRSQGWPNGGGAGYNAGDAIPATEHRRAGRGRDGV